MAIDDINLPTSYLREKLDAADNLLDLIAQGDEIAIRQFKHYLGAMDKEIARLAASAEIRKGREK